MEHSPKLDPDEMLFTLDQLEQTTEVMARVVSRLKRQLHQTQNAPIKEPQSRKAEPKKAPPAENTVH